MGGKIAFVMPSIGCFTIAVCSVMLYSVKRDGCVILKCRYVMI
jgi:hypothetical protein